MAPTTTCRTCREAKPDTEFYETRHGKPYLDCKRCHSRAVIRARAVRNRGGPPGAQPALVGRGTRR